MIEGWEQTMGAAPLLGIAAGAILLLLVLVIRFKTHAFLALTITSLLTALATGIPLAKIVPTIITSFGNTLGSVALLVGLGAMLGKLVEFSGGAAVLAERMVSIFGEKRAPFALGLASLIMGFPIFFDAGLVVMLPVIFAVAQRLRGPVLAYGIPAAAAFSVMHVFAPPHPGPVSATELYNANLGVVLLLALVIVFPLWYLTGARWGRVVARRHPYQLTSSIFGEEDPEQVKNPPRVGTVIACLLVPLGLIFLNTGLDFLRAAGVVDSGALWFKVGSMLGTAPVALLIAVLFASYVLGYRRGEDGVEMEKILDSALGPICSVVIITGAGGMFGGVLRASGIGDALAHSLSDTGLPLIVAAYLVSAILRVAQGSATVALVTAAGLMAPAVAGAGYNPVQLACIVLATAAGSVFAGHVNDSGFWLVGRLMGMAVTTTLKVWTVQQAIESVVGFGMVCAVFGVASLV